LPKAPDTDPLSYTTLFRSIKKDDIKPVTPLQYNYILGNPPFIGSKLMNEQQRSEVVSLFDKASGAGVLDYVTAWYILAAQYMQRDRKSTRLNSSHVKISYA